VTLMRIEDTPLVSISNFEVILSVFCVCDGEVLMAFIFVQGG